MTRKSIIVFLACIAISLTSYGQKAKFKKETCKIQKMRLPQHRSSIDERTFDLVAKGMYSGNIDPLAKRIYGWSHDPENPTVRGVVSIYGYSIGRPRKRSQRRTQKNKDGKVTSQWTEYWYTNQATGKATLYVYGELESAAVKDEPKEKSKAELRKEEKEAEERKDLEDNPFLSEEIIADADESEEGEDSGIDNSTLPLSKTIRLDNTMSVESRRYKSASKAYEYYQNYEIPKLQEYRNTFPEQAYRSAVKQLNKMYGFAPVNKSFQIRMMKTEDHEQYKMWNDACQATITLFKTFAYNQTIEEQRKHFEPIIKYFTDQLNSIPEKDKKQWRHKRASYRNLVNILFFLDMHDEVIELSNRFLDSKKLDSIAKRMKREGEKMKESLEYHQLDMCHLQIEEEIDEDDIEEEETEDDDED